MSAQIRLDDSEFPLVVNVWPDSTVGDAELEQWLAASQATWARGRHVVLQIGVRATSLTALQRRRVAEFAKANERALARTVIGTAVVADSPLVRGIVTAVNWVAPPPYPQQVFSHRAEAEAWLRALLTRERSEDRAR